MDRPNVLLIIMDTARARDVLGREDVMPNLHRIAAEGATFTNAFTTGPWTLPSHASIFTGQYTSDHGTYAGSKRFTPDVSPLAERLRDCGYRTVAFSNNTWVSPDFGFDRGFDEFFVGWELFDGGADLATIAKEYDGPVDQSKAIAGELLAPDAPQTVLNALYARFLRRKYDGGAFVTNWRFKRWLSKRHDPDRPFFAFINYLEPHLKYDPPKRFRDAFLPRRMDHSDLDDVNQDAWAYICDSVEMDDDDFEALTALYRAELAYLDHRIGKLYDHLEETGVLEDTAIIIAGDHGENIGDHGLMDHQYCLYDTLLHVPLVIRYPEVFERQTEDDGLIELRDLFPTILDIATGSVPDRDGVSAVSLTGEQRRDRVLSEYVTPQPSMDALEKRVGEVPDSIERFDRGLRAVRTTTWKYIEGTDGSQELYDVQTGDEREDRAAERPDLCASFEAVLETRFGELSRGDDETDVEMDEGTKHRLEDLGYLQ